MELSELLRRVAESLEKLQIPYLVTGSIATIDIDTVVDSSYISDGDRLGLTDQRNLVLN